MRISDWSSDVCSSDLVIGERARVDLIDAYLDNGPEMVSWLAVNSEVVFLMSLPSSDWYPELPGAKHYGRVLSPREYDGKKLGRSEEHTSELQSLMRISYAVFCLKKKQIKNN